MSTLATERMSGMGAMPHEQGVAFRVWAPHADAVSVIGTFNKWDEGAHPLEAEGEGRWYADVPGAAAGDEYRYVIRNGDQKLYRIDPRAREVTNSVGNAVVHDPEFDWEFDNFELPPWNEIVIYEMHVGTIGREAHEEGDRQSDFDDVETRFDHLRKLGVNVIQLMPIAEFAGDISWGYNPAHIFAVESAYGGPREFKSFVKRAHQHGLGVILDVVYNHFGPSDLDLWQFDGWSENGKGGIYFYNDWRSATPWGETRPDYGRGEVRQFIFDNAMMWLEEYHIDGLRYDMTFYMRTDGRTEIPEGWSLARWINGEIAERYPGALTIAEDLQNNEWLTRPGEAGGAGFGTQWDAGFVHPVREALILPEDRNRSMWAVRDALCHRYNDDVFERVVYTESHDEVANGKARVPEEINADDPGNWYARKRSTLGAVLTMTAPGIPMLFQGQEFLQGDWFDDQVPLDWDQTEEFSGILHLYRDLIRLRTNRESQTKGLTGQHIDVHHVNDQDKLLAFHRWFEGGPGDDVLVVLNFSNWAWETYEVGVRQPGKWKLRLNTDWSGYSECFGDHPSEDFITDERRRDGSPATAVLTIGPYSALVYSQDPDSSRK